MTKFMYLFRGGEAEMEKMTPKEKQENMQVWKNWMNDLTQKGILVDGLPLSKDGKRLTKKGKIVSDGPYAEGKEIVAGYLIVNANNLDEAAEISKGCPIFQNNGEVEVREILSMDV